MTVYVYKLPHQAPLGTRSLPHPWYGLTADTEDELHPLAETIGLYRHFYHPGPVLGPGRIELVGHYDIDQGERDRAVASGATAVTWNQVERWRQRCATPPGALRRSREPNGVVRAALARWWRR